ncbi:hypothetical protein KDC22_18115 [Paenibacillus tritici]|uniref:DUF4179 domain-containing protein n=1 Tax=Paenibacillus tritici TaxID=1873425 RepID=UPI001BA4AA1C|nr:DUF4179 domain-containing protein [Paenibacillus tritici]QUL52376.1 hypothetical protein KDC22_18115 [Paenibacillus tritici]
MSSGNEWLDAESGAIPAQLQEEAAHVIQTKPSSIQFAEVWKLHSVRIANASQRKRPFSPLKKGIIGIGTVLAIIAGSITGIGFISPQVAEALRVIPFFDFLYAKGAVKGELKPIEEKHLSSPAGAIVKDQGITFNLVEQYYDGIQLVLNYEVSYPPLSDPITDKEAEVYYELNFEGYDPQIISTHDFTITSDHTFVGTTRLSFGDKELPGQLMLNMGISQIGTTKGKWDVSVPLFKNKSDALTTTVYPKDLDFTYKKSLYSIDRVTLGPVTSQVIVRNIYPYPWFDVMLEDDIGTLYLDQGGGATLDYYYFNFSPLIELNPKPEYVTLIVAETLDNESIEQGEDRRSLSGPFPLTLQGNQGGTVTITAVDYEKEQTVLYYEASQVISQATSLTLQTGQEHTIFPKEQPVRIERDRLVFKQIFPPVQLSDMLEIVAQYASYPAERKQFRLRIPLQWGADAASE